LPRVCCFPFVFAAHSAGSAFLIFLLIAGGLPALGPFLFRGALSGRSSPWVCTRDQWLPILAPVSYCHFFPDTTQPGSLLLFPSLCPHFPLSSLMRHDAENAISRSPRSHHSTLFSFTVPSLAFESCGPRLLLVCDTSFGSATFCKGYIPPSLP